MRLALALELVVVLVCACGGGGSGSAERPNVATNDLTAAVALYQKACDAGNAHNCTQLGSAYHHGRGIPRDVAKAAALYQKACNGGDMLGCTNLGASYERGNQRRSCAAPRATGVSKPIQDTTKSPVRDGRKGY